MRPDGAAYRHKVSEPEDMRDHLTKVAEPFLRLVFDFGYEDKKNKDDQGIALKPFLAQYAYGFETRFKTKRDNREVLMDNLLGGFCGQQESGWKEHLFPKGGIGKALGSVDLKFCVFQSLKGWKDVLAVWYTLQTPSNDNYHLVDFECTIQQSDRMDELPTPESAGRIVAAYSEFYEKVVARGFLSWHPIDASNRIFQDRFFSLQAKILICCPIAAQRDSHERLGRPREVPFEDFAGAHFAGTQRGHIGYLLLEVREILDVPPRVLVSKIVLEHFGGNRRYRLVGWFLSCPLIGELIWDQG